MLDLSFGFLAIYVSKGHTGGAQHILRISPAILSSLRNSAFLFARKFSGREDKDDFVSTVLYDNDTSGPQLSLTEAFDIFIFKKRELPA
jgi:hypothetical protein